jgi:hypothetical protein
MVIVIFVAAAALCVLLSLGVSVNYEIPDYLPKSAQSTKALKILGAEFDDAVPNARVMLKTSPSRKRLLTKKS